MYQPQKYSKNDPSFIFEFIEKHPFATMVSNARHLIATHIPVLVEGTPEDFKLYAHIANHNEQLSTLEDGAEVLLIFHGAQAYISSSWYEEKDISTWDYSAVHINARIQLQNAKELEISLKKLVEKFEKGQKLPLYYNDIPKQTLQEHLPLITGFWARPFKIQGIAKLHQGASKKDMKSNVAHLKNGSCSDQQLASAIEKEHNIE